MIDDHDTSGLFIVSLYLMISPLNHVSIHFNPHFDGMIDIDSRRKSGRGASKACSIPPAFRSTSSVLLRGRW
jgi:hypothetical protein